MRSIAVGGLFAVLACIAALHAQTPVASSLRIVVLAGEDAVNIVQQKTAVRPLVEVRDRNNLPVAGVTVTFTIGAGQPATFAGGVRALTVTTNAAGQAEAAGFNALGSGSVQIQVQATYQGQVATAAISQTNFATAAAAIQAGVGAGAVAGAAAAGGGGGLSATTIGIVGAAIGGGALAATQLAGGGDDGGGAGAATQVAGSGNDVEAFDVYRGSFSGPFLFTTVSTGGPSPSTCVFTRSMTGTVTIDLRRSGTSGTGRVAGSQTDQSVTSTCILATQPITISVAGEPATGGPSALTFSSLTSGPGLTTRVTFVGSFSGNTITGSLTIEMTSQSTFGPATITGSGATTVPVTLQR